MGSGYRQDFSDTFGNRSLEKAHYVTTTDVNSIEKSQLQYTQLKTRKDMENAKSYIWTEPRTNRGTKQVFPIFSVRRSPFEIHPPTNLIIRWAATDELVANRLQLKRLAVPAVTLKTRIQFGFYPAFGVSGVRNNLRLFDDHTIRNMKSAIRTGFPTTCSRTEVI